MDTTGICKDSECPLGYTQAKNLVEYLDKKPTQEPPGAFLAVVQRGHFCGQCQRELETITRPENPELLNRAIAAITYLQDQKLFPFPGEQTK